MTWRTETFQVPAGTSFERTVQITSDGTAPVDLTGYTGRMQARVSPASAVVLELTTTNGGISIDGPAGAVTLRLAAAATDIAAQRLVYDVNLTSPDGFVSRILAGEFVILASVTRGA